MSDAAIGQSGWVEPMRNWLDKAVSICNVAHTDDFVAKKSLLREIFGLNLFLTNKNVATSGDQFQISPLKNPWSVLRTATQKAAREGDQIAFVSELERIFAFARTYFSKGATEVKPLWQSKDNLWNTPRAERKRGKRKPKW